MRTLSQRQDEVRGKEPRETNPKFVCSKCGQGYYSATDLDHLHDPYCSDPDCRGELIPYHELHRRVKFEVRS